MVVAGFGAGTTGATVRRGSFGEGGCSSRVSKNPVTLPLGPLSFGELRTGSQTPVEEASPLCTPLFISLLGYATLRDREARRYVSDPAAHQQGRGCGRLPELLISA